MLRSTNKNRYPQSIFSVCLCACVRVCNVIIWTLYKVYASDIMPNQGNYVAKRDSHVGKRKAQHISLHCQVNMHVLVHHYETV